jgi:hypothetical protein
MRPTKLTPETVEVLCDALGKGMYLETSGRLAGVAPSTLHGWLSRGRIAEHSDDPHPDEVPFLELLEAVKKAQARAEMKAIEVIIAAAEAGTWQAAAWFLERSNPAAWTRPGRVCDDRNDSGQIDHKAQLLARLGLSPDDETDAA